MDDTKSSACRSTCEGSLLCQQFQPALSNLRSAIGCLERSGRQLGWVVRHTPFISPPGTLGKDLRSTTHHDEAGKAEFLACLILSSSTSPCPGIVDVVLLRIIP
ncbi:hypothetical protein M407DRAFT_108000 [Tulasnella calospora MUT 4182]|uniref:Uncharacterized protein n=1 Tax=Tulasnella calospora MUT 4182 TaxID=1051891 RepID=A0A0C3LQA9_9AGAM|nr:hypothetical protein M407DRAFT_108000 [Tulasnella calospora MUT 4182]